MKKAFKWIGIILATPVVLFLVLTILLYIPPIQNFLVDKAAEYASEKTGMQVTIDNVRLSFPLDLELNKFLAVQEKDTVLSVEKLVADVQLWPLLSSEVQIDAFDLEEAKVNTRDLIKSMQLKGKLQHFYLNSHGVELNPEKITLNDVLLEGANLDIALRDSVPEDTTKSEEPSKWKINVLQAKVLDSNIRFRMKEMDVQALLGELAVNDVEADLQESAFKVPRLSLLRSGLALNMASGAPKEGLDYDHIQLDSLNLVAESFFNQGSNLKVDIKRGDFVERSGLRLSELQGNVQMDAASVHVTDLLLRTPHSHVDLNADLDWTALDEKGDGQMMVALQSEIGKKDMLLLAGPDGAKSLKGMLPESPMLATVNLSGNMQEMLLSNTKIKLDKMVLASLDGSVRNLLNDAMSGSINLNAQTGNVTPVLKAMGMTGFAVPSGLKATGLAKFSGSRYSFDGNVQEGSGRVKLNALYDTRANQYRANVDANNFNVNHFLPADSIYLFSGKLDVEGRGLDFNSPRTTANIKAEISQLQYGKMDLRGMGADLTYADNNLAGHISSDNEYIQLSGNLDAFMRKAEMGGVFQMEVESIDLYKLGMSQNPMQLGFHFDADVQTDREQMLKGNLNVTNTYFDTPKKRFTPTDIHANAFVMPDTLYASLESGDLDLKVQAEAGIKYLTEHFTALAEVLQRHLEEKHFNVPEWQAVLPDAHIDFKSGRNNPFHNFMAMQGYGFKELETCVHLSPDEGINADAHLYSFMADSLLLDTIRLDVFQQDSIIRFKSQVRNNKKNPDFVFNAMVDGRLMEDGVAAKLQFFDEKNRKGIDMGARCRMEEGGYRFNFRPDRPFIAYHTFNLNPGAYVFLHDDGRVEGDMSLLTDEGMGLIFKANPTLEEQQNMNLELQKINLEEIMAVLPYMPRMTGLMDGTVKVTQPMGEPLTADARIHFDQLTYEGSDMGKDIVITANYVPENKEVHKITATMQRNGEFVTTITGTLGASGEMDLGGILYRFPAEMINGFIPDHMVGMRGIMEGDFRMGGTSDKPLFSGSVKTDSVYVYSDMYGVSLRMQDRTIILDNSTIKLDKLILYSDKNDELSLNGNIDFTNLDKILLNLSMIARDFQVVDRKRDNLSLLYGKAFVNLNATIKGSLDAMVMRGTLNLLGSTDVTYVLKDSPLTVEDRLQDLVTFVDFSDTTQVRQEIVKKPISGMDMVMNLNISEGARVGCDLSANRESYVDLTGGGDLVMKYGSDGEMRLTGRYTINNGEMKYALPVIPLKTFHLASGSYVEFTGDMGNPHLNITATEQMKASVAEEGSSPRSVLFDVGVQITKTLADMGLEFTIDAPEDMNVQNELASMSKESRGKMAVSMLATGLYISENNAAGGVTMNSALNSFLQSEINNIAGNALQSIDLSFGMEDGTARDGSSTTDYSFRFAKRLWGNRVSIIIGGKVSTGANAENSSFIDDISIEYRLDDSGTRYVKLFHEKTFDSLLDGEITETGGGIVLRKKMTRFGELFIFRSKKKREQMIREYLRKREEEEAQKAQNDALLRQRQEEMQQKETEEFNKANEAVEAEEAKER